MPDDIDNMTEDQLRAEVERLRGEQSSADLYGGGGTGGGSPVGRRSGGDHDGEFMSKFEEDWNNREPRHPRDFQRYVSIKLGRHTYRAMKETGKRHIWGPQPNLDVERY